ncbi:TetR/AcrR family transcriptional regulator [Actinomycetes bacterium M1A6_2h]
MVSMSTSRTDRRSAISAAILAIVAERGIEHASVREVAARAQVSIGTVQHYFPTKEAMLVDAYTSVFDRIRSRLSALEYGNDVHRNLSMVVEELLPIDERRAFEVRLHAAFAAKAATDPSLRSIETELLGAVYAELAAVLSSTWTESRRSAAARAVIALADGLALHGVSTDGLLTRQGYADTVSLVLTALLAD